MVWSIDGDTWVPVIATRRGWATLPMPSPIRRRLLAIAACTCFDRPVAELAAVGSCTARSAGKRGRRLQMLGDGLVVPGFAAGAYQTLRLLGHFLERLHAIAQGHDHVDRRRAAGRDR